MRLNQINLNLFLVFDAIYTEQNLTRAAEVLSITQPAVSNALNRLRDTFNDQLFVRTSEGMKPTPLSENIVEPVRQALQLLNMSVQTGDAFTPAEAIKTFNLSVTNVAESWVLPLLLNLLQEEAPGISLSNYELPRTSLPAELASGKIDLAINAPLINDPNLNSHLIAGDPYVCIVRENHPVVKNSLSLEEYLAIGHVHVSNRRVGQGYVDTTLNNLGLQRDIRLRVGNHQVGPELVKHSDLALTIPRRFVQGYGLKALPLPFKLETQNLCLYWHKSVENDHANRWLRKKLMTHMGAKKLVA